MDVTNIATAFLRIGLSNYGFSIKHSSDMTLRISICVAS